ncbi:hypothetical protein E4634_01675 [Mangrovimicrobium sediminis]|uniref:Hydrazine synthase alpha subunit middle domain-containing protein n=1 Tax=Mangrovimicrobium sediminis TaxID=2562682 RepID=A0A4Z0M833_9GAMM|nr:hypothetical protein [Haliea sp. SAOS-164]TGD75624.1 hypothetical protein E4634_01675 [Haliea sp. SAOS-164]
MSETRVSKRARRLLPAACLLATLTACGGGGGGGSVTLVADEQGEDPVVLEIPIAYVRRPLPETATDLRDPLAFTPGAELWLRDSASTSADETNITEQIAAIVAEELATDAENLAIDIKDLESSYAGDVLLFAARVVPEPVAANLENTTWNLWWYDLETGEASYVMPSRIQRNEGMEAGGAQDIAPHFLPDDRIVFSSTRQVASQARLLDEGRSQLFAALDEDGDDPAAVLHIYDPLRRGEELTQISFNRSHDLDPTVTADGEILFSRWNNSTGDHISLYRIRPSGAGLMPVYGFHSENGGTEGARIAYAYPRELDDGRLATLTRGYRPASLGGEIVLVDAASFADLEQPLWQSQGAAGSGQESLTDTEVRSDGLLSPGGQYASLYPLRDGTGRLLVTWSACRVVDEDAELAPDEEPDAGDLQPCTLQPDNTVAAPPNYGAWVYDPASDTQRPVVLAREGFQVSEAVALENRDFPAVLPRAEAENADLAVVGQGQLRIDSLYDSDGADDSPAGIANHARPGSAAFRERPARFLRILQPVPLPDPDVYEVPRYAFGVSTGFGFREILGYVPVEPDGSVTVNIPAQRAFNFEVLDVRGRRIGGARHDYWLQLAPGEVLHCTGCHDEGEGLPHGREDSAPVPANPGARALPTGILGYPNTDTDALFADTPGDSMAATWDARMPLDNPAAPARELASEPAWTDLWSAPDLTPEASIDDRAYDPAWTNIPPEYPIIVRGFDSNLPGRIVINYPDHIQPIWDRVRAPVMDGEGNEIETCTGCHTSAGDTVVPAGQLDLDALPSDAEPLQYRSYRELLTGDGEQWLDANGALADRVWECTVTDDEGNTTVTTQTPGVAATAQAGSANGSERFFACFEGGSCGPADAPPLPANCIEESDPVPATRNTIDHVGLLSEAELRLVSEWLDIGAQYFNNPFDSRLAD